MRWLISIVLLILVASSGFAAEVLYDGVLGGEGRSRALRGSWEIVEQDDGKRVLVLGEDFFARNGPDLKIFFSKLPLGNIHDRNAGNRSHAIKIGRLRSSRGMQEYPLPDSLDLTVYSTWIVHCEAYAHFWDGAELDLDDGVDLESDIDESGPESIDTESR